MKNMPRYLWYSILLGACLSSCSLVQNPEEIEAEDGYPTIITRLPQIELEQLRQDFIALGGGQLCDSIDGFGFIRARGICYGLRELIYPEDEYIMIQRAKETVVRFGQFTGVNDTASLVVEESRARNREGSGSYRWLVVFKNQIQQNLPVMQTEIEVLLNSERAILIHHNWFKEAVVPAHDAIDSAQALQNVIGMEITWYGFGGDPHIFTVAEENLISRVEKVIVPLPWSIQARNHFDCLRLHVAWKIGIADIFPEHASWYLYIDTTTGEVIHIEQMFVT